ncbi:hypothetical protein [Sporolactobacillus pectinivorans]|uniref:hypothetical protein n=1 Tax=Sporolactobacillus pectinivorans TaxID=1591408 RepID=UPI000C268524|nr:hypothetical protein [Sporolactobacillus pectinivorans]
MAPKSEEVAPNSQKFAPNPVTASTKSTNLTRYQTETTFPSAVSGKVAFFPSNMFGIFLQS